MANNIVFRRCLACKVEGEQDEKFSYRGDTVWACHACGSMYTEVSKIIDPDKKSDGIDLQSQLAYLIKVRNQWIKDFNTLAKERDTLRAENKKLKEQQLMEDEIVGVLEDWSKKYSDPYEEILYKGQRESIAKAIIKAREDKIKEN